MSNSKRKANAGQTKSKNAPNCYEEAQNNQELANYPNQKGCAKSVENS